MSSPPESITDIDENALNKKRGRAQSVEPVPLQELDSENLSSEEISSTTVSAPKKTKRDDEDSNSTTTTVSTIRKNMKDMTTTDNNPSESKSTTTSISQDEDDEAMGALTKEEFSLASNCDGGSKQGQEDNDDDWGEFAQDDDDDDDEEAQKGTTVGEDEKPKYTFGASSGFGTKGWTATHQTIPTPSKQPTFGGFGSTSGFGGFRSSSNDSPPEKKESTSVPAFGSFAKTTASPFASAAAGGNAFTTTSSSTTPAADSSTSSFNNPSTTNSPTTTTTNTAAVEFVGHNKEESDNSEREEQGSNGDSAAAATFGEGAKVNNSGVIQAEIVTGEEDEKTIYQTKGKLLVLDTASGNWKERGVGTFRINVKEDTKKTRLVMRTDSVYRIILNLLLFTGMNVFIMQDKFVRFAGFEAETKEDGTSETKLVNFALKLKSPSEAEKVLQRITCCIPPSPNHLNDNDSKA